MAASRTKARFIDPMLLRRTDKLPEDTNVQYEVKLDGYRAIAFKSARKVHLRSRNDKDFNTRYPAIVKALAAMPDETVIDGEVVARDEFGKGDTVTIQERIFNPSEMAVSVREFVRAKLERFGLRQAARAERRRRRPDPRATPPIPSLARCRNAWGSPRPTKSGKLR